MSYRSFPDDWSFSQQRNQNLNLAMICKWTVIDHLEIIAQIYVLEKRNMENCSRERIKKVVQLIFFVETLSMNVEPDNNITVALHE